MKPADYQCDCGEIREYWVKDTLPFPEYIMCQECGNKAKRKFSATPSIIHQGKCGNYKNSYTSSPVPIKKT